MSACMTWKYDFILIWGDTLREVSMFFSTVSDTGWSEVVITAQGSVCGCEVCGLVACMLLPCPEISGHHLSLDFTGLLVKGVEAPVDDTLCGEQGPEPCPEEASLLL